MCKGFCLSPSSTTRMGVIHPQNLGCITTALFSFCYIIQSHNKAKRWQLGVKQKNLMLLREMGSVISLQTPQVQQ